MKSITTSIPMFKREKVNAVNLTRVVYFNKAFFWIKKLVHKSASSIKKGVYIELSGRLKRDAQDSSWLEQISIGQRVSGDRSHEEESKFEGNLSKENGTMFSNQLRGHYTNLVVNFKEKIMLSLLLLKILQKYIYAKIQYPHCIITFTGNYSMSLQSQVL